MKIGIDVRSLAQGKKTGVEEYTQNILTAIFELDDKNEYVLFFNKWNNKHIDFSWALKYDNVSLKQYKIPNKLLNFSLWFLRYPKLDKLCGGVDIFFMPNNNFCALSKNVKLFLTVHDLSFEHFKKTFSLKRRIWHYLVNPRALAGRADVIFAVSESTKIDLCQTYKIKCDKIIVAKNGLTFSKNKYTRNSLEVIDFKQKHNLPYNFILYFGTIEPRKNIVNIIEAYNNLRKNNKNISHSLVIAGARGWNSGDIYDAINNSKYFDEIIVLENVSEKQKMILYTLASVFIYPSFFEGFGFPPCEAIACGTPTIVSHSTSLPEIVQTNALMINPSHIEEIVCAMKNIIKDKDLQQSLSNTDNSITVSQWEKSADLFIEMI